MTTHIPSRRLALHALAGLAAAPLAAWPQSYPQRPVTMIIPFVAGGSANNVVLALGPQLAQRWGYPIVLENRPGNSTLAGTAAAAKAPPDGLTLLFIANSFVINAKLRPNLPYDGVRAFEPVAMMVHSPQVIVVRPDSPHRSLRDLLEAARARPKVVTIGSLGPATAQHIAVEQLMRAAGVEIQYTPHPSSLAAMQAAAAGQADAALGNYADAAPHLGAGRLRVLAVTTSKRIEPLTDVPTVAESGVADYEAVAWFGVAAPAGTPKELVARISEDFRFALQDPEARQKLAALGMVPAHLGPAELGEHLARQLEHYGKVIEEAKIRAD